MSSISQVQGSTMAQALSANGTKTDGTKTQDTRVNETNATQKTGTVTGRTIGNPKLSEKAAKYYEQLKKKFSNMDFILVSEDQKQMAQSQAASYGNPNKQVVLINEEKLEKMAEDEKYRKQYEGIIARSQNQLASMKNSLGSNVKSFGISVDDKGLSSYFAVVDKSFSAQKNRISKKAAEKKAAKKAEQKKAEKKAKEERLKEKKADKADKTGKKDKTDSTSREEDLVVVKASSYEELKKKIDDITMAAMSDQAITEEESKVGQHFDFKM